MIDRVKLAEELQLREYIRKAIRMVKEKQAKVIAEDLDEEVRLRSIVQRLIKEEVSRRSTGINELETLLTKVIPQIEADYKTLSSNEEQRHSFRAHILRAVQNTIATILPDGTPSKLDLGEGLLQEKEYNIEVDPEVIEDADQFIPVRDSDKEEAEEEEVEEEEPEELSQFGIEGADRTGRNVAFRSFRKVEKAIKDSYNLLSDEGDRQSFYEYLITNLKLYFDKFEDEMAVDLREPTTPEYEEEKEDLEASLSPEAAVEEIPVP